MTKKLDSDVVAKIKQLLDEGELLQKAIAVAAGVSLSAVNRISCGGRPAKPKSPRAKGGFFGEHIRRCPGCGVLSWITPVAGICYACQVRRIPGKAAQETAAGGLAIDLQDQDQQRYEAMRVKAKQRRLRGNRRLI